MYTYTVKDVHIYILYTGEKLNGTRCDGNGGSQYAICRNDRRRRRVHITQKEVDGKNHLFAMRRARLKERDVTYI